VRGTYGVCTVYVWCAVCLGGECVEERGEEGGREKEMKGENVCVYVCGVRYLILFL
jgi:hypothetical protein